MCTSCEDLHIVLTTLSMHQVSTVVCMNSLPDVLQKLSLAAVRRRTACCSSEKVYCMLQMVDVFRQAARNAIDAGFDGVEVHGANVSRPHCFKLETSLSWLCKSDKSSHM